MFTRGGLAESEASQEASGGWTPGPCDEDDRLELRGPDDCAASLRRTIEAEIVPRLMLAHAVCSNDPIAFGQARAEVGLADIEALTELVLRSDAASALAYVRARLAEGLPLDTLYLRLLTGVADELGARWKADLCDFSQVTVGLWRLQQIVYEFSPSFQSERRVRVPSRRALLMPAPGSQHTFGVLLVGEFFRRAGWEVHGDPCARLHESCDVVTAEWFDLIGVSVGSECQVVEVASAILELRRASRNPAAVVMVGGPIVASIPDFVLRVGADGTAADAASAVAEAEKLMAVRA